MNQFFPDRFPKQRRCSVCSGFTLIEVMLAMAITAFIALLAYSGLSTAIVAAEQHGKQTQQIADIQLPLTLLERDIRHAVNRPIVDEYEDSLAAMKGGRFGEYSLVLTRLGWANPMDQPRGELQRVRYLIQDNELWRESWSVIDRVSQEHSKQTNRLLEGVLTFELEFLDGGANSADQSLLGGEWVDEWDQKNVLPLAIEVTLEIENFGELRRVFSIPSQ